MMKKERWLFCCFVPVVFLFGLLLPMTASASHGPEVFGTYAVEDVALSPGADASQLDIAWQTKEADVDNPVCVIIAEKRHVQGDGKNFPRDFMEIKGKALSPKFYKNGKPVPPFQVDGTSSEILDEDGNLAYFDEYDEALYPCEATITGLKPKTKYVYVLGDGDGNWSDVYEYTTQNPERYGMFYVADSQIGASAPKDVSRSSEILPAVEEYYETYDVPAIDSDTVAAYHGDDLTDLITEYLEDNYDDVDCDGDEDGVDGDDADIACLVDVYTDDDDATGDPVIAAEIDEYLIVQYVYGLIYDEYSSEGNETDLASLDGVDSGLQDKILTMIEERVAAQLEAVLDDGDGWAQTLEIMNDQFPKGAFLISGGDQVENADEYEWTNFFAPEELRSLPVAPTVGSHDKGENYDYHFNLPNESGEYGVNSAGGDYYYRYGNALVMVLNMDATKNEYPKGSGGPPPSGGGGEPPSGPPPSQSCEIDSEDTFLSDIYDLEHGCTTDDETGVETCTEEDGLADFKTSIDEHTAFMQAAIDENPDAKWKIVMWHYSIYSAGNHSADDEIRALRYYFADDLDALDIDLVLMAHDHVYTRTYQMEGDDPLTEQTVGPNGEIINPTGVLYVTGSTSSGSKFYSLNCAYDVEDDETTEEVEGPDVYFEYVAYADDMVRTVIDEETEEEVEVSLRSFSYIDVDANKLRMTTYGYDPDNTDELVLVDSYTMLKVGEKPDNGPHHKK